ncbi:hypothetical protein ABU186_05105 [Weissella paramesenteroides]
MKLLLSGIMRGGIPFIILGSIAFVLNTQNSIDIIICGSDNSYL